MLLLREVKVMLCMVLSQTKLWWFSVATTDGIMNSVSSIIFKDTYYEELYSGADFLTKNDDGISLLNRYLDNTKYRNQKARETIFHCKKNVIYSSNILQLSNYIDSIVLELSKTVGSYLNEDTDALDDLFRLIRNASLRKTTFGFTKKEFFKTRGWGKGMKWAQYRQRLLSHSKIYDVDEETPMYIFSTNENLKDSLEYEIWLELIKRQDKREKKIMFKLRNTRIEH